MPTKKIIFMLSLMYLIILGTKAQSPPPPPPSSGSTHGSTTNHAPAGGSAPIGSGHLLLLGMAGVYALYKMNNKENHNNLSVNQ